MPQLSRRMIAVAIGGTALMGLAAAPAPVAVSVGDGTVNATRLVPYDNAFAVTYEVADGERIETGIWSDQLRMRDVGGRKAWVRVQSLASFTGLVLTSVNTFDPATFAPISTILKNRDGSREYWTYSGTRASGHIIDADGHTTEKTVALSRPGFDFNCCMASLIPAALPLAEGRDFALPGVPAKDGDPDIYPFHVRGRERIKAGSLGMVDAWAVELHPAGNAKVTFWITDKPRRLVRERLEGFPTKTCMPPDIPEHASCQAQAETAGLQFNQTFDMLGSR